MIEGSLDNLVGSIAALAGVIYMVMLAVKRKKHTTIIWFNAGAMLTNCITQFCVVTGWNHAIGNAAYEIASLWLVLAVALAAFAMYFREYGHK